MYTRVLVLLLVILQTCSANEEILFDSYAQSELLSPSGKWRTGPTIGSFEILNGRIDDTIETRLLIRYGDLQLNAVYLNITYQRNNHGNLLLDVLRYMSKPSVTTSTVRYTVPSVDIDQVDILTTDNIFIDNATMAVNLEVKCSNFSGKISRIVLYTYYCPSITLSGMDFPRTFSKLDSWVTVQGSCKNGTTSAASNPAYLYCGKDGTYQPWKTFIPCICTPGMGYTNRTCKGKYLSCFRSQE